MALIRCGGAPTIADVLGEGKYLNAGTFGLADGAINSFTKGNAASTSRTYININLINVKGCTTYSQSYSHGVSVIGFKSDGTATNLVSNQTTANNVDITDYDYLLTSSAGGASGTTISGTFTVS